MSNQNKPREWEIKTWALDDESHEFDCGHWVFGPWTGDETVHVIEYSAYQKLESELASLRAENEKLKRESIPIENHYHAIKTSNAASVAVINELKAKLEAAEKEIVRLKEIEFMYKGLCK